jgi:hypothetical protein
MLRAQLEAESLRKPKPRRSRFFSPVLVSPSLSELENAATETERSSESSAERSSESPSKSSSENSHVKEIEIQVKDRETRQLTRSRKPSKRLRDNEEDRIILEQVRSSKKRKTAERYVEMQRKNKAMRKLDLFLNPEQRD